MQMWIFIAVISAAAVTELLMSARAMRKYSVIVPAVHGVRISRRTLERIYDRLIKDNRHALMIIYTDGADHETLEMCRRFSRENPRAVIYRTDIG